MKIEAALKFTRNGFLEQYRYLLVALALNVPLIFVILLMDLDYVKFGSLTWIYISCVIVGYYVLPILIIVTLQSLFFFISRKAAILLAGAVIQIYIFYLLIDHFVYSITKIHIDLFWLEWIIDDYHSFGLRNSTLFYVVLALVGVLGLEFLIFKIAKRIRKPRFFIPIFIALIFAAFGISQAIHMFAYHNNYERITNLTPHFPIYFPIISQKHAVKYGSLFPVFEADSMVRYGGRSSSLNYPLSDMRYNIDPVAGLPNIVIIYLESWRIDALDEETTPNIYDLSQKSSLFLNHFCSGNSTVAGVFGLFYGIHPTYWTAVKANSVYIDNPVFIDLLKENDYSFGIYAKSNFTRHKIKDTVFRGIEVHESFAGHSIIEQDRDMTDQLLGFFKEQENDSRPFMAFAFYKSDHFPYHYPATDSIFLPAVDLNFMLTTARTDPAYYLNDYRNSTHYVDGLVGELLEEIETLGYMDNTIIIISTDHSDELNDNRANYWGHGTNFTQYQTRVPLVIYFPGREPGEVGHTTSHVDIVPTLLQEYYGCENDIGDYSSGRNLFEKHDGIRPIVVGGYVNHAFIIEDNVYEIYPLYTKKYKLHDIKQKASNPPAGILAVIKEEINRFYIKTLAVNDN